MDQSLLNSLSRKREKHCFCRRQKRGRWNKRRGNQRNQTKKGRMATSPKRVFVQYRTLSCSYCCEGTIERESNPTHKALLSVVPFPSLTSSDLLLSCIYTLHVNHREIGGAFSANTHNQRERERERVRGQSTIVSGDVTVRCLALLLLLLLLLLSSTI